MSLFRASLGGLGLVALSACFVACGDDEDKDGGTPDASDTGGTSSSGGKSSTGGTEGGVGGASSGGTSTEAGSGGAAPTTDGGGGDGSVGDGGGGTAFVKFCNPIAFGATQQSVTFRLTIGAGATAVTVEAASGTCTPAVNLACTGFPSGTGIPVEMVDIAKATVVLDSFDINATDGQEFILGVTIDNSGAEARPIVEELEPPTDAGTCSAVDYDGLYPIQFNESSATRKTGYTSAR